MLHLALSDSGGAGNAAFCLHLALRDIGIDSKLLVANRKHDESKHVYVIPTLNRWCYAIFSRLGDRLVKGASRSTEHARYFYPDFNYPMLSVRTIEKLGVYADAIIVHSVSGFVSSVLLAKLSNAWGAPVFWHLLDMGLLTGGCHFSFGCEEYARQCGHCPALRSAKKNDWSHWFWQRRRMATLSISKGVVVTANRWIARQARISGILADMPQSCIELSVNLETNRPLGRAAARKALGLPEDGKYIFFGAHYPHERRKGVSYLIDALRCLVRRYESTKTPIPSVITAGAALAARSLDIPLPHHHLGYLDVETQLPLAYQAADVFVSPSIEDTGPMMIQESLACGTPVVAFNIGVAPDVLVKDETGYIAKLLDADDLSRGIEFILSQDKSLATSMSRACRALAESRFSSGVQARAFRDLIEDSLNDKEVA